MKKLAFCIISLLAFYITNAQTGFILSGDLTPLEGSTQRYTVDYNQSIPSGLSLTFSVQNGTIINQNNNPYNGNPVYVQIQWNCAVSTGSISLTENTYNITVSQSVSIQSYINILSIYDEISPREQNVTYGSTPQVLSITNGANICTNYTNVYQWQVVDGADFDVIGGSPNWIDISNSNSTTYAPPAMYTYGSKAYRRITKIYDASGINLLRTIYSRPSYVKFTDFLNAGSIYTSHPTVSIYQPAVITSIPALGGLCSSSSYQYTWENTTDNLPWQAIGTGETYPTSAPVISKTTQIRRKIQCGSEIFYSNILTISVTYTSIWTENLNYIRTNDVLVTDVQNWLQADVLSVGDKFQRTEYLDGLGRSIQTVDKEASYANGTNKDVVTPYEYDEASRELKNFIPYVTNSVIGKFKSDAISVQPQFITNQFGESPSYATTEFDNSPLNRVTKSHKPGSNWAGNGVGTSFEYEINSDQENVHIWDIQYTAGSSPSTSPTSVYASGQLVKSVTIDENLKKVITYTDKAGNMILRKVQEKELGSGLTQEHGGWLCTYYVYDDFGRQRFIITPKAVKYLDNNNWTISSDVKEELCFYNEYDKKGRLIVKKSPGAHAIHTVYDKRNRITFMQDGNQRALSTKNWTVTLYDNLNRQTLTGLIDYSLDRDHLQDWVDNYTSNDGTNVIVTINNSTPLQSNLVVNLRNSSLSLYQAVNSITFDEGFESETGADFIVEIGGTQQTLSNPANVNGNPLPSGNNLYTLSLSFYDGYFFTGAKAFSTNFTIDNSVPTNQTVAVQKSERTINHLTGTKTRLLDGSNNFLTSTILFDENSRVIQIQTENHKGFLDETTTQYDFSGKIRSSYENHRFDGNNDIKIFTRNTYDILSRITKITKSINGSADKDIVTYSYNEFGQLANKKLAPGFGGEDGPYLENLDYSYNIHGWLTGINKSYSASATRTGNYFGMELGYDKASNPSFANLQTQGNISGTAWKSRGDNIIRKYDYAYDNIGQIIAADFNQRNTPAASWTTDKMNFSSNYSYDENGNILTQNQWGVAPGLNPVQVDQLVYHYALATGSSWTNKLKRIEEQVSGTSIGSLGDFRNGLVGSTSTQYEYDNNANTVKDLNKEIGDATTTGIQYNHLNLPTLITFKNTNKTISYIYDAAGSKLRKVIDEPASGSIPARHVETDYSDGFVYQTIPTNLGGTGVPELEFFDHREGRVRIIKSYGSSNDANFDGGGIPLPGGRQGVFDYFVKDHLGNIRMILTEEVKRNSDIATMEVTNTAIKDHEESIFGKTGSGNEVSVTRYDLPTDPCNTGSPNGWTSNNYTVGTNPSAKVSKLSGLVNSLGPNVILKVMAGDKISTKTEYYYKTNNNSVNRTTPLYSDIVTALIGAITSDKTNGIVKGNSGNIQTILDGSAGQIKNFTDWQDNSESSSPAPKAYLNYVFFDEQFNYVGENSDFKRVNTECNHTTPLVIANKEVLKNGWVFVYLSNVSDEPVYFDNFQVTHERGRILEENHYYSYGLKIAGISSRAEGKILNNFGYQGDFAENDKETSLDEFDLRHFDPQIGRWTTTDPYEQFVSPYTGMGNDPINNIDPTGGWTGESWLNDFTLKHFVPAVVGSVVGVLTTKGDFGDKAKGAAWGFAIGMAASYVATEVNWKGVAGWIGDFFENKTLWMFYDGVKILDYYESYKESQTEKHGSAPRKPKVGEKPILETTVVEGTLKFKDGDVEHTYTANSGYENNGAIPDGDYTLGGIRTRKGDDDGAYFYNDEDYGYTIDLLADDKRITRTDFRIHPTSRFTRGCIGILGKDNQERFANVYKELRKKYKRIKLQACNINGIREKIIDDHSKYQGEQIHQFKKNSK